MFGLTANASVNSDLIDTNISQVLSVFCSTSHSHEDEQTQPTPQIHHSSIPIHVKGTQAIYISRKIGYEIRTAIAHYCVEVPFSWLHILLAFSSRIWSSPKSWPNALYRNCKHLGESRSASLNDAETKYDFAPTRLPVASTYM